MNIFDELKKLAHSYEDEDGALEEYSEGAEKDVYEEKAAAPARTAQSGGEEQRRGKVVSIHATAKLKVVLLTPKRFEDAADVAEHLKSNRTVVMNLEKTDDKEARRLVDFLSGVAFAGEGKIKKVSAKSYIITPYNVDIEGDLIDELESSGLYF